MKFRKQNRTLTLPVSHRSKYETLIKYFQVLASSVAIADRAGEIVRSVFSGGQLGIVEKTGADDLQTQADRSAQVGAATLQCILIRGVNEPSRR